MNFDSPKIIFRDEHYVAVNKPAGLMVHRSALDPREERFALQLVRNLVGRQVYPVHRLDRGTSGLLLFALEPEAARLLAEAFADRLVTKNYLAVVRGVTADDGEIDYPLAEVRERNFRPSQRNGEKRQAVTMYNRLAMVELPCAVGRYPTARYSLMTARPLTGRRRQIRRHFKHIFHPVIGDTTYGDGEHNRFFRQELDTGRLLLHAGEVAFSHPFTGEAITLAAPLDEAFAALLDRLGWRDAVPASLLP